jgi:hypothetical protein
MMGSRRRGWRRRVVLCGERVMTTFTKKEMFCLDCIVRIGFSEGSCLGVWKVAFFLSFFFC